MTKISIIMATFNRAHLIGEALTSIQNQSYTDWECIIVDDNCTDNTKTIVETFIKNDLRFRYYLRHGNYKKGISGSRNFGIDLARGKSIIFFDDDDIVHPRNLEICLEQITKRGA